VVVLAAAGVSAGAESQVYPGSSIQTAIDGAGAGDTIYVHAGTYVENVDVDKRITLIGDGADVVMVQAADVGDHVFRVSTEYVNISGFKVTGTAGYNCAGIYLIYANHCNISDNNASDNNHGIHVGYSNDNILQNNIANSNNWGYGIYLHSSSNNTLAGNIANSNNDHGIHLRFSNNNTLTNNIVNSNNIYGICLRSSNNNTLQSNNASGNNYGIHMYESSNNDLTGNNASDNHYGIYIDRSSNSTLTSNTISGNTYNFGVYVYGYVSHHTHNIDTSNTVDGRPIYYWVDQQDKQIPCNAGFVGVVNSTNITVKDLILTDNAQGVLFAYTDNSRIENVSTSNNYYGICLYCSSNNILTKSIVSNNDYGIRLHSSSNNTIMGNTANLNDCGIYLHFSSDNTLTNNTANSNKGIGIGLESSCNNTLTNNTFINDGFIADEDSNRNKVKNNNVNGKPLVYLKNASDFIVQNAGQVVLVNCTNITVENLNLSNTYVGVGLFETNDCKIVNNIASNNNYGIYLCSSSNYNAIYYNNLIGNTQNAYDTDTNQWDSGSEGNYWSDYIGTDSNSDGIGDTPYIINGNAGTLDRYPFMEMNGWQNTDVWKNEWMGEDSDGGTAVTTTELQDAIHHWLEDIRVRGHLMSTANLQEIIVAWLSD
jgi:parallel beta-helix repeat protein